MDQQHTDLFSAELKIDETAKGHIRSMASWVMVIVVIAVIGYVISVLQYLSAGDQITIQSEGFAASFLSGKSSRGQLIFSIAFGLLLNFFLFRFATGAKTALNATSQSQLATSFRNLKIFFVITSIILILAALLVFIAFFGVLFSTPK